MRRFARQGVWIVLAAAVALVPGAVLFTLNRSTGRTDTIFSVTDLFKELGPLLAFLLTGAMLVTRRPGNLVGTLCAGLGLIGVFAWTVTQYAAYGLVTHPGSLPGALWLGLATQNVFALLTVLLVVLVCVFPDGRLLSPRWRIVPAATIASFACLVAVGLTSALSAPFEHVHNPLRVSRSPILPTALAIATPIAIAAVIGALASVVVRFRRSHGDGRAQLKWLGFAASTLPIGIIAHSIADWRAPGAVGTIELLFAVAVTGFPVAIGVAVLKYRLYDIDRLISRTISYLLVTGVLVGVFVGIVLLTTRVLPFSSPVGVAASTLAAAALFTPLRRRVQGLVDRRFNRTRYDAETVLAAFSDRLREAVDLESVETGLLAAVSQTTAPAHVSIWLRNDPETVTQ